MECSIVVESATSICVRWIAAPVTKASVIKAISIATLALLSTTAHADNINLWGTTCGTWSAANSSGAGWDRLGR